ncbi:hypothetical protein NECAME_03883 [Necator americanus]|uniref:Tc1-like transposase DDE domain-containing protein n=1 Tax=Necator americanus TaxID=51031 RepID=W2SZC4_NECAM|nr:hypothetical protein NECAME_03883 [Necator americanus]ETN74968.1 hypothetical protein NECAME_03883 [Necator americanus]
MQKFLEGDQKQDGMMSSFHSSGKIRREWVEDQDLVNCKLLCHDEKERNRNNDETLQGPKFTGTPRGAKNYVDLLKDRFLPWANAHFGNRPWTYQQDGAPTHNPRMAQNCNKANFPDFITFDQWPAN